MYESFREERKFSIFIWEMLSNFVELLNQDFRLDWVRIRIGKK